MHWPPGHRGPAAAAGQRAEDVRRALRLPPGELQRRTGEELPTHRDDLLAKQHSQEPEQRYAGGAGSAH